MPGMGQGFPKGYNLGEIVRDHIRQQEIDAKHKELCEKLTENRAKLLTHEAMYQILEGIRKERGYKQNNEVHRKTIDKLREQQDAVKKELFLFRLKYGLKHD